MLGKYCNTELFVLLFHITDFCMLTFSSPLSSFFTVFETGSHITQGVLELAMQSRLTFELVVLLLLSLRAGMAGLHHYVWLCYLLRQNA